MPRGVASPINPFRFGGIALDDAFADREDELRGLKADMRNGQDVVIFAPRRYGKSSLIWRATQELTSAKMLVAYVNLLATPSKERLAERLASAIYENVTSALDRAREKALAPFRGLRIRPTVTVDPDDGSLAFSFGVGNRAEDVDATLERLLEMPAELAARRRQPVAVVFDEFQEIVEIDPALPRLMRTIFEQQPEVARVYLGSKRHMMERLFNDENEPFWRSAKQVELDVIAPSLFRDFIVDRFRSSGKNVEGEVVADVLGRTSGHPYATQELCYALWEQVPAKATATGEHLAAALAAVLRSEHAHFSLVWENASSVQRLVLDALADEPGHPLKNDYRIRHRLPSSSSVQKALKALTERELTIKEHDGSHRIAEPFLAEWIVKAG